ncbi:DNA recombination protein RmuC [Tsuneonella mangrovi]|uniref:DNA recombination protein RmuC n=1 Tax=Tsuneonella mangrovi TaxID=1982042 RepID=UPI000BA1E24A|nr:DNA recombination protein RmuC [Tsuneonella mangrovi]
MDTTAIFLIFLVLIAGLALGWFVGSRPAAALKASLTEREGEFKAAIKDLGDAQIELATLKANAENFDKQIAAMKEAREEMLAQFKLAGDEVLTKAQERLAREANERLGHAEKTNKEAIKALLEPVGARLKAYEEQVGALEAKRVDAFGQLSGVIEQMRQGQEAVRREAQRLGNSLTNAPKARGRWGERALQNLLEQCGLAEHTDFMMEHSIETEDGRLRPDAIVRIPGGKMLVIDSKVSLNAYQEAFEADNEETRARAMSDHVRSMRNHVQTLGAKSYQSQFEEAPDYVVMFVPGEHFVAAALEHDPELWNFAFDKRVLLATPTNLVAIARTVAQVWRQDGLAREAQEIGKMGAELYDRLRVAADHLKRVGGGLETAVNNYNKFVGSFERNVLSSGKRLAEKGIEIGKAEIDEVPLVEAAPRYTASDDAVAEPDGEELVESRGD